MIKFFVVNERRRSELAIVDPTITPVETSPEMTLDSLTGLPGRGYFENVLNHCIKTMPGKVCVAIIDINDLKRTNDSHGHAAGDKLIQATAEVLDHSTRDYDLYGEINLDELQINESVSKTSRYGGDELAVILQGIGENAVAANIITRIEENLRGAGISAAIGYSLHEADESAAELVKRADENMFANKKAQKEEALKNMKLRDRLKVRVGRYLLESANVDDPRID